MKYKTIHDRIIGVARNRAFEGYTERHHIIPRCMGGTDDTDNIVKLTAREHFIVHQLLVKIYPNIPKLVYAVKMMTVDNKYTSRSKNKLYGWLKEKHAIEVSKNLKGKKQSEEHKAKRAKALMGNTNNKNSAGTSVVTLIDSVKYSSRKEAAKKLKVSERVIRNWVENGGISGVIKHELVKCPHCGKTGGIGGMKRYHFENCKEKKLE